MSYEDNLDTFLDVIDADPDWSSDEEDDISKRANARPSTPPGDSKNKSDIKFEDIFGSPIKKKSRVEPTPSVSTDPATPQPFDHNFFESLKKTEQHFLDVKKPSSISSDVKKNSATTHVLANNVSNTSDTVIDPYSRISIFKASVNLYCDSSMTVEAVLKDRNLGIHYVNLMALNNWYRTSGKDNKKFWTSGVLTKKLNSKKSAKGNDYAIWEINDLKDLKTNWTIFLFGGSSTAPTLMDTPIGAFIDVVTPSVLDSSGGPLKLSVTNPTQIRHIGTGRYFGYCQAKRKDGQNCTVVVNTIECGVCIHHASGELKKLNRKSQSSKAAPTKKFNNFKEAAEDVTGVITANFGGPVVPKKKVNARMELQGGLQSLHKNSLRHGNHSSISFEQPKQSLLPPKVEKKDEVKEPLKLDPQKTRHLTDKDRQILEALGTKNVESDLPCMLAQNPNAGSRNYIQYLAQKQYQLDKARMAKSEQQQMEGYGETIGMNREMLDRMKKALNYVRKNGPITKANDSSKKRKLEGSPGSSQSSSQMTSKALKGNSSKTVGKPKIDVVFDFDSDEYKKILNAKSKHETLLEEVQQEEYFERLEKKEAIENKMLNTFTIATNAVMCRECKYVAVGQSDYCKEKRHTIRIVKATKRFFKCKDCGNRAMSLDRLPKHPCKICKNTSWLAAPVGKERKGPVLESEVLAIRGDEERFLGSSGGKLFLNMSA
ncbi:unnamed protein product [Allacma fusca]|uniref:Replication factor Mcm10 C-terminal domain-containing protein n=1 Tax=Allacma fusca TaxID=39272 RepID=A0A8J2LLE2_9HEXA|nr:unnamed protein product [Allacma fusca]